MPCGASTGASQGRIAIQLAATDLRPEDHGSLALATVFATGLSGGMLLSRALRLLVALASLATVLFGGTLLGRGTTGGEEPSRKART